MKTVTPTLSRLTIVLMCALTLLALGAAERVAYAQTDAYSVEVAVSERSDDEQQEAYTAALRRILLNNSGDKTVLNRDDIRQALRQADIYVQAFSYRRPPPGTVIADDMPITSAVQQSGQATQLMLVSFDQQRVNELIASPVAVNDDLAAREEELMPVPGADSALVWLLIRDQGRYILISDPEAANVQTRAREIAGAAGVSLVYPAGDTQDEALLPAADIELQTFTDESLQQVASRYAQGTLLVGDLSWSTTYGWQGRWIHFDGTTRSYSEFDTESLDEGLQQGLGLLGSVSQLDETYRYGGSALSGAEGLVWVGSLDTTEDYAQTMSFLQGVEGVATVYAKEVQSNYMVFSVVPRSALSGIGPALINAPWLQRSTTPLTGDLDSLVRRADLALMHTR